MKNFLGILKGFGEVKGKRVEKGFQILMEH